MLSGYADVLDTITKFRERMLTFGEYKQRLLSRATLIGPELDYPKSWANMLDAWLELIEYFYSQDQHYELGCSLGYYLEDVIVNETRPMALPEHDEVVKILLTNDPLPS